MSDEQLKRVISMNRRPKYFEGNDMVRVRKPDPHENNNSWNSLSTHLGKVGKIIRGGANSEDGTVRVQFTSDGETIALRGQWVELIAEGEQYE